MKSGITLIALVITIIVMIVLASVSINAIVGDNGIITQAQNATVQNSIANLEEYLQELYIENYDTIANGSYESKVVAMADLYSSYFYIPANDTSIGGSMRYVVDSEGHALYLIQKSGLPDEIQEQLVGGEAGDGTYSDYQSLTDVYGVTSDLKVYYCSNGSSTILGITEEELDEDNPNRVITLSSGLKNILIEQYANCVNEDGDITAQTIRVVTDLTITGTDDVSSLSELYNLTCLKTLTLENVEWSNISGIENASILNKVYFSGCTISNYSALADVKNLTYLYVYNTTDSELSTLCNGIASAEFSKLNYMAVVGGNTTYINDTKYIGSISSIKSENTITTLEPLNRLSDTTKNAVQYLSINNNDIAEDLSYLADYTNLIYLRCEYNSITSLNGLDDMEDLVYLQASYNSLGNGSNEADTSIASLYQKYSLKYVYMTYNSDLAYVAYLNGDTAISYLYLAGCSKSMLVSTITTVLGQTNGYYSLPVRWLTGTRYSISEQIDLINEEYGTNYTVSTVPYSVLESDLYGNSSILYLNLENCTDESITNDNLNELLASMPQLTYVTLKGCTSLTTLDFVSGTDITVTDENGGSSTETSQVTGLIELDLRDTGVTNLTPLNVNAQELCTLRVNCEEVVTESTTFQYEDLDSEGNVITKETTTVVGECAMDLSLIETCLNHLNWTAYWYNSSGSYTNGKAGLVCNSTVCLSSLSKTTNLTSLYASTFSTYCKDSNLTLDLSKNSKLEIFRVLGWCFDYVLPPSVTEVVSDSGWPPNFLESTGVVDKVIIGDTSSSVGISEETWILFFQSLNNVEKISYLMLGRSRSGTLDLSYFYYCQGAVIEYFQMGWNSSTSSQSYVTSLNGISYLSSSLATFKTTYSTQITDWSDLAYCENLTTISITYSGFNDTSIFYNLTQLTSLTLDNNSIYDLSGLSNLSNLKTLSLKNNSLGESGLKVISELKTNYGVLSKVYLSGNDSITDWSYVSQYSGWNSDTLSGW